MRGGKRGAAGKKKDQVAEARRNIDSDNNSTAGWKGRRMRHESDWVWRTEGITT